MKRMFLCAVISLLIFCVSCNSDRISINNTATIKPSSVMSTPELTASPKSTEFTNIRGDGNKLYYGTWEITEIVRCSDNTGKRIDSSVNELVNIGKTFTLSANRAIYDKKAFAPKYREFIYFTNNGENTMYTSNHKLTYKDIGITNKNYILYVNTENALMVSGVDGAVYDIFELGSDFYLTDDDTMVVEDGLAFANYYLAKRVKDESPETSNTTPITPQATPMPNWFDDGYKNYYGEWEISDVIYASDENGNQIEPGEKQKENIGKKVSYSFDSITINGAEIKTHIVDSIISTKRMALNNISFPQIGIIGMPYVFHASLEKAEINSYDNSQINGLGTNFYLLDEKTLIVYDDTSNGDFYLAKKIKD